MTVPIVRQPALPFATSDIPAHWFDGDRVLTRSADAMHMLFPSGERFFMRSVRAFTQDLRDPALKARVRGFLGQEAMHGREHEQAFALLIRDGIEVQSFLDWSERAGVRRIERWFSPLTCLAVTCALEHLTASMGARAFSDPRVQRAHPVMRQLMLWHAAEEVEHKSVAFDVYRAVGGGYFRRIFGMLLGYLLFMWTWSRGMQHLLAQDGGWQRQDILDLRKRARAEGVDLIGDLRRAAFGYLRPNFHPDDEDNAHLAEAYFAEVAFD